MLFCHVIELIYYFLFFSVFYLIYIFHSRHDLNVFEKRKVITVAFSLFSLLQQLHVKSTSIRSRLMHRVGKLSVSIMQSFKAVFLRWRAKRVFVAATIAVSLRRGAVTPSPGEGGGQGGACIGPGRACADLEQLWPGG